MVKEENMKNILGLKALDERFKNWAMGFFYILTPPALLSAAWIVSASFTKLNYITFESPQQKEQFFEKVKSLPTPSELILLKSHVNNGNVHRSKGEMDSLYVSRDEFNGFIKNMALDTYNMNRKVDILIENQQEDKRTLRLMYIKLDNIEKSK